MSVYFFLLRFSIFDFQLFKTQILNRLDSLCNAFYLFVIVLGAVLTPADPISMVVLAVPLWFLFEFGLKLMKLVYKPRVFDDESDDVA